MSEYTLAGVYVSQSTDDITPAPTDTGRYVAVIGHMNSGSSDYDLEASDKFATGQTGTVFVYDSMLDYKSKMGVATGSDWSSGTHDSGSLGAAPFDPTSNFMRAVEMAFIGGAKRVYGLVLSGSGTDAVTAPDGLAEALAALRAFDDVYYVVLAGYEPITAVKTEVIAASAATEGKERVYVTGVSWHRAFSGSDMSYTLPSLADSEQDDNGRVICIIANTTWKYTYSTGDVTDTHLWAGQVWASGTKEIGGNFLAAYVAGRLSSQDPHIPLSYISGWIPSFKGNKSKAVLSTTKLESMWNSHVLFPRRWTSTGSESWSYDKGWLFVNNATTASVTLITTRQILDSISKDVRNVMQGYLFKANTETVRASANSVIQDKLRQRKNRGWITDFSSRVYASASDEANNIMRCQVAVKPVFETLKIVIDLIATLTV